MTVAIHVESLGKLYRLGERQSYFTLRDRLGGLLRSSARMIRGPAKGSVSAKKTQIWALRDVSFEVQPGEVIGLIGRNGAGKSTLLKMLSRVTLPTSGWAEIQGRVGSLLEVGTGFHPELTGRENVFLNGAILGMRKREISRKFDEIVSFAEVADFIDTPIRHYSSGMQMRLAFAVAAHFEPQILLVDEVLAVGDLAFQKKCLGKMDDVARGGRTIIFVSHQMNQIRRLCQRALWIDGGRIRADGTVGGIVGAYEASMNTNRENGRRENATRGVASFQSWEIVDSGSTCHNLMEMTGPVSFRFLVVVDRPLIRAHHGIALFDSDQRLVWGNGARNLNMQPGTYEFVHQLPHLPLKPGTYSWRVTLFSENDLVDSWDADPDLLIGTQPLTHWLDEWAGVLNVPSEFLLLRSGEKC